MKAGRAKQGLVVQSRADELVRLQAEGEIQVPICKKMVTYCNALYMVTQLSMIVSW